MLLEITTRWWNDCGQSLYRRLILYYEEMYRLQGMTKVWKNLSTNKRQSTLENKKTPITIHFKRDYCRCFLHCVTGLNAAHQYSKHV